ncbi:hypothetical protein DFJ74DRAFT_679765 [Hyaloraphidium curvatum]|nr:hypothetical protein DFJ74DRAFT_679765 [Hyaloraphidium curvatum]
MTTLEERVRRLEDLDAVRAVAYEYCHRLDVFDTPGLARETFAEDCVLESDGLGSMDGVHRGRDAVVKAYTEGGKDFSGGPKPAVVTGHFSTNHEIELDGDQARMLSYYLEIVDDSVVLIGTHQWRLVRQDRWRIAALRIVVRYRARIELKGRPVGKMLHKILKMPKL